MDIRIMHVDPQHTALLIRWNGILRDGYAAGRRKVWSRSDEATRRQFQNPHPTRISVLLLAEIDGVPVGAAEAHVHPGDPADVEIAVLDRFRRRGIARALLRAVRDAVRGTATLVRTETYSEAGVSFARSEGLRVGIRESRQVVDLPLPVGTLESLPAAHPDIEVVSWVGACPDELLADWARLRTHMSDDVPMGDLTRTAAAADVAAVRRNEERMSEQGYALVRSVARTGANAVGYTEILLSRPDPTIALQDDTFVEERVRGRGIGRALKVANLRLLMTLPESSASRFLQTYTAPSNAPMLALNRSVGFTEVDVLTVLEGPLG
ncbi:GNAT family N-acetyltransferase [Microbacterium oxydans]|nr:GNAT family N-acetyltransferase [Microbacterium oxydans]